MRCPGSEKKTLNYSLFAVTKSQEEKKTTAMTMQVLLQDLQNILLIKTTTTQQTILQVLTDDYVEATFPAQLC